MSTRIWAVLPAAGIGRRMGAAIPKQYLNLRDRPVIHWSLDALLEHPRVHGAVLALAAEDTHWEALAYGHDKPVHRVRGGAERAHSVLNALRFLAQRGAGEDWVLVHDAVRPCLDLAELDALLDQGLSSEHGALLAVPVRDTLKRADRGGHVAQTVQREGVWHALTPQLFPLCRLLQALEAAMTAEALVTDEASAMERAGYQPRLVEGRATNLKITRPADLDLAAAILEYRGEAADADRAGL
ncbi:2-C-methyl-D-erythritol 4-phosphate cytidylyltransferase [Alkalilimnicola sp. S0819]|uniref:2-C-methyl-D-erythritol 4-phosphate cytidylyltransferase n=1 Tax=Alkalilimnicola sp. S0819 TaxID=2613922 RepID=UPI0012619A75|nr:2-C-methyl-D-erythritol 4-phosphate cytidylyltransferase [Alkalilimnicola sp. S0819]KAB7627942.1 2-C-methyl-D-erythritol 4-phosphate cytidylyltransferase [Alkalilimnicola sp. S0819]MPQ15580.1 2-C-methyl-D-erythritol 4-phosphate cytidylyltransferase [Alkalilimnicola sp. S0819]